VTKQKTGWHLERLNVPKTWTTTRGENVRVLVIDTGHPRHNDLKEALIRKDSRSFLDSERSILDFSGHSLHVCGLIGARDNEIGMVGVAPECKIITCKSLGKNGEGTIHAIRQSLRYAKFLKPHIINMSLGTDYDDIVTHRLIKDLYDMNIPIVAAVGNERSKVNYPAKYPETISVAAFDKEGKLASFNCYGDEVDFSAPGVNLYSTYLNNDYAYLSGTSMATPVVTGIVALLLAKHFKQEMETGKNDCVTVSQIKHHLVKYSMNGEIGKDKNWGYGVIDVEKSVNSDIINGVEVSSETLVKVV
jgi:subtilisin